MKRKIVKLLLLNIILFTLAVGIYAVGYEYDRTNKIYPEMYYFSDAGIMVYGKRWERISKTMVSINLIIDIFAVMILYRQNQRQNESVYKLIEENK
ncbi:MAG: hypothetical protein M3T96_05740 [Acidobacteriota bacterium]|nr:hypothetical protein [Acidobacteriota bacterium]